ncbi:MAG: quinone-dependent dihydroorotate dehydrogenase [Alphaproteobacteria bacterium]|nr:quinone-dependent dihydroorotate dehydrogenase [Alphaproteobacteria bacterium]
MRLRPYRAIWPLIRLVEPELAHRATLRLLSRAGMLTRLAGPRAEEAPLRVRAFGLDFANPVGLAAGFDKDAEVYERMLELGFGFVEVGSLTPRPQPGNPRPRLFRLEEDRAVINRLGFNNSGHEAAARRLARRGIAPGVLGVNLGANKDSEDRIGDYVAGLIRLGPFADYVTVNVSSPNTPGLRALQGAAELDRLLGRLGEAQASLPAPRPLVLKIAPDLLAEDVASVAEAALRHRLAGLIVSNTTIARPPGLRSRHRRESGGLSGAPLLGPSTELLRQVYRLTEGRITLIGAGGVASGADALAKIKAGASLVQLYSALVYEGPGLARRIRRELALLLREQGFAGIEAAVGREA